VARETEAAVEIVRSGVSRIAFVTCEHASEEFPEPWSLSAQDSWLKGTHWTHDVGARELALDFCRVFETGAVLSGFSRLVADPNRPPDAADLFRDRAEGRVIELNRRIDQAERDRRLALWTAYHRALDREVAESPAAILLAVHTFTPSYEGAARDMEIGVLFDGEAALAEVVRQALDASGFRVAMNEPYSGKDGLMYSVDRHARRHGRRALELEMRQDLAVVRRSRRLVAEAVLEAFKREFA